MRMSEDELSALMARWGQGGGQESPPPVPYKKDPLDKESDFQKRVVKFATDHFWLVFHPTDMEHSKAGYPDLTMIRYQETTRDYFTGKPLMHNGKPDKAVLAQVIFAELKDTKRQPTAEQCEWLETIQHIEHVGYVKGVVRGYLWHPEDWHSIMEVLR